MSKPAEHPSAETSFRWLRTGQEGLDAMLAAIQTARRSVCLETYIFDASPIAQQVRDALTAASSRGVRVRVLVDAIGSVELPDSFWTPLRAAGGEMRWFNPIALKRLSHRDHRKILVVDEAMALIGGFNVAAEYYGDGVTKGWRDLGLEVTGPLAGELVESFDVMFALAEFKHKRFQRLRRGGTVQHAAEQNWRLLLSGPGRAHRVLKRSIANDLATSRLAYIVSAYFLPTWRIRRELRRAGRRRGKVRLLLAGKSDVTLSQLAGHYLYRSLLRAGVEIHEYQPQILHTKLFIVNDTVYVGSANLDARSLGLNYELLVRIESAELAAEGRRIVDKDLEHSRQIKRAAWRKSRGFFRKLMESVSYFILARLDPYLARWQWRHWWGGFSKRRPTVARTSPASVKPPIHEE